MRYFLDTEFNGYGGQWLTLALVREDGRSLYLENERKPYKLDEWVAENVAPIVCNSPEQPTPVATDNEAALMMAWFFAGDDSPTVVADWPDDFRYLCELLITGPGRMAPIPGPIQLEIHRVDAYPTKLPGAIQHNAWWDAMALRELLMTEDGSQSGGEPREDAQRRATPDPLEIPTFTKES